MRGSSSASTHHRRAVGPHRPAARVRGDGEHLARVPRRGQGPRERLHPFGALAQRRQLEEERVRPGAIVAHDQTPVVRARRQRPAGRFGCHLAWGPEAVQGLVAPLAGRREVGGHDERRPGRRGRGAGRGVLRFRGVLA